MMVLMIEEDDGMNVDIQDPVQLANDGVEITSQAAIFNEEITKIYGIVDDLKNSWVGQSSQRFTQGIESYRDDFVKFADLISKFGDLINAVGKDYQNLEENL